MNKKKIPRFYIYSGLFILILGFSYFFAGRIEESLLMNKDFAKNGSLFLVAFIIGIIDGFNPCAMWILIYLITLVGELHDKKKMWLIVGTFLFASGAIYFIILSLYLAGWELALYLGYTKPVLILASIFALTSGFYFLYEFYKSGGQISCNVGDIKKRKQTMGKIKNLVNSNFTLLVFIGLVLLAFSVNLVEFFCSIGLPQVFTGIISVAEISTASKYFYMAVYILAFMADDLLVFYLALKAIQTPQFEKYSGLAKLVGGVIMILLGVYLIFFML